MAKQWNFHAVTFCCMKAFHFHTDHTKTQYQKRKEEPSDKKVLGLYSQRNMASAFEGFQGCIKLCWVETAFAVHQLLHIHFRKVICGAPCGYLQHVADGACDKDPKLVLSLLVCPYSPKQRSYLAQDPKAVQLCWISVQHHTNWAFCSPFWS